jgi:hypothetical protein
MSEKKKWSNINVQAMYDTHTKKSERLDEKLEETKKFRAASAYGLSEDEVAAKLDSMVNSFGEGFRNRAIEEFKHRDIESIYNTLSSISYRLNAFSREVEGMKSAAMDAMKLFDPITPYPFKTAEQRSDKPEVIDDEVTGD